MTLITFCYDLVYKFWWVILFWPFIFAPHCIAPNHESWALGKPLQDPACPKED